MVRMKVFLMILYKVQWDLDVLLLINNAPLVLIILLNKKHVSLVILDVLHVTTKVNAVWNVNHLVLIVLVILIHA